MVRKCNIEDGWWRRIDGAAICRRCGREVVRMDGGAPLGERDILIHRDDLVQNQE